MKTKGLLYLLTIFFVIVFAACDDEHEMTKYGEDSVCFENETYNVIAKADKTVEVPIFHRIVGEGGKAEVEIVPLDGAPEGAISLENSVVTFTEDTVNLIVNVTHSALSQDETYSYTLKFKDSYLSHKYGDFEEVTFNVQAFKPTVITDFVGTWSGTDAMIGIGTLSVSGVVIEQKDATTLTLKANSGIPAIFSWLFETGWGETFIDGYGLNGDIEIEMELGPTLESGDITLTPGTFWGVTDAGYGYWYVGSGTWTGGNTIDIYFELHWDQADFTDGGNYATNFSITLD